jgi:hypothetical protein
MGKSSSCRDGVLFLSICFNCGEFAAIRFGSGNNRRQWAWNLLSRSLAASQPRSLAASQARSLAPTAVANLTKLIQI